MDREERVTARVNERLSRLGLRFDTRDDFDTARRLLVEAEAKLLDQESAADAAATVDRLKIKSLEAKLDACEREREELRDTWKMAEHIDGRLANLREDARALAQALTPFAKQEAADTHEGAAARRALARPGVRRLLSSAEPE